jgi:hypothetical protein
MPSPELGHRRNRLLAVVRMDELEVRLRQELFRCVAESLLDGRIDAREMSLEVGDCDQVGGKVENTVKLVLRLGPPRRVKPERGGEAGDGEAGGEDDPGQNRRGALYRFQRHGDAESLSGLGEGLAHGRRAPETAGGASANGDLHGPRKARGRRAQQVRRHEQHDEPRFGDDRPDGIGSVLDEKEPLGAVLQGCHRRRDHVVHHAGTGRRRGQARFAAEIGPGHLHGRDARDESRRQVRGPGAGGHDPQLRVLRDDGGAGPPLVRGTLRSGNLLDPRGGGKARRYEPSRRVVLELRARELVYGQVFHEPAHALGERGSLIDALADLGGRDLGAVLRAYARVSLTNQAGPEETREGHPEDQRYWCNLPKPHAPLPGRELNHSPPRPGSRS